MRPCLTELARAVLPTARPPALRPQPRGSSLCAPTSDDASVDPRTPWRSSFSENELQCELNLSRRGLRARDLPGSGKRRAVLIEERGVAARPAGGGEVG